MSSTPSPDLSFEEAMSRLDEIVEAMEGERLNLEDMVERYEEGVKLLTLCRQRIDSARLRVERINFLLDGSGKAALEEFEPAAETADTGESPGGKTGAGKANAKRGGAKPASGDDAEDIRLF